MLLLGVKKIFAIQIICASNECNKFDYFDVFLTLKVPIMQIFVMYNGIYCHLMHNFDIYRNGYHTFDPSYITQYAYMCITLKLVAETSKFKPNYKIVC